MNWLKKNVVDPVVDFVKNVVAVVANTATEVVNAVANATTSVVTDVISSSQSVAIAVLKPAPLEQRAGSSTTTIEANTITVIMFIIAVAALGQGLQNGTITLAVATPVLMGTGAMVGIPTTVLLAIGGLLAGVSLIGNAAQFLKPKLDLEKETEEFLPSIAKLYGQYRHRHVGQRACVCKAIGNDKGGVAGADE